MCCSPALRALAEHGSPCGQACRGRPRSASRFFVARRVSMVYASYAQALCMQHSSSSTLTSRVHCLARSGSMAECLAALLSRRTSSAVACSTRPWGRHRNNLRHTYSYSNNSHGNTRTTASEVLPIQGWWCGHSQWSRKIGSKRHTWDFHQVGGVVGTSIP